VVLVLVLAFWRIPAIRLAMVQFENHRRCLPAWNHAVAAMAVGEGIGSNDHQKTLSQLQESP
jgi:uncharacterized membrane protein AbrB (regulator of aidB expression)